jgi:hypothetical protein
VGALKGIVVQLEKPWDCWDIPAVGDLGCCHLFVQLLEIELWEWRAFHA